MDSESKRNQLCSIFLGSQSVQVISLTRQLSRNPSKAMFTVEYQAISVNHIWPHYDGQSRACAMDRIWLSHNWWEYEVQRSKGEIVRENLHAPCRCALSFIIFHLSDEHSGPVAWATSAGNYQFQTGDVERQLLKLTEGRKRKSRIPRYDIKIKCKRMVGQCPACPRTRLRCYLSHKNHELS